MTLTDGTFVQSPLVQSASYQTGQYTQNAAAMAYDLGTQLLPSSSVALQLQNQATALSNTYYPTSMPIFGNIASPQPTVNYPTLSTQDQAALLAQFQAQLLQQSNLSQTSAPTQNLLQTTAIQPASAPPANTASQTSAGTPPNAVDTASQTSASTPPNAVDTASQTSAGTPPNAVDTASQTSAGTPPNQIDSGTGLDAAAANSSQTSGNTIPPADGGGDITNNTDPFSAFLNILRNDKFNVPGALNKGNLPPGWWQNLGKEVDQYKGSDKDQLKKDIDQLNKIYHFDKTDKPDPPDSKDHPEPPDNDNDNDIIGGWSGLCPPPGLDGWHDHGHNGGGNEHGGGEGHDHAGGEGHGHDHGHGHGGH